MKFESSAIVKRVTLRFSELYQYVFPRLSALRILYRSINLAENSAIVELLLGFQHAGLAQSISRPNLQFTIDNVWPGIFPARNQHLIDVNALAFVNLKGHIHTVVGNRLGGGFKTRVRVSVIKVVVQQDVAILRDVVI